MCSLRAGCNVLGEGVPQAEGAGCLPIRLQLPWDYLGSCLHLPQLPSVLVPLPPESRTSLSAGTSLILYG